jgi:ribosomal protein S18 acetylase RimI-like enzyme
MTITFERATADDAQALMNVQIAAFHNDAVIYPGVAVDGPPGYDSIGSVLRKIEEDEYYKIVFEGQIIGGIVVYVQDDGHFHLDLIYIDPAYHGRGIGTQAIQFIEGIYAAQKWSLHTPLYATRNHHFYEKFGYVKVGEEHHDDIILIAYEKRIGN